MPTGPNQLWVTNITYIPMAIGFVYLAAIFAAWSRRAVEQRLEPTRPCAARVACP
jgi:putative transposase